MRDTFEFKVQGDLPYGDRPPDAVVTVADDHAPFVVEAILHELFRRYGRSDEVRVNKQDMWQGHYYPRGFQGPWEKATIDVNAGGRGFLVKTTFPTHTTRSFTTPELDLPALYRHAVVVASEVANSVSVHHRVGLFVSSRDELAWSEDPNYGRVITKVEPKEG